MLDLVPSRYNVLVPLRDGRALAYNSSCGGLAIWSSEERRYYDRVAAGDSEVDLDNPKASDMVGGGYLVPRSTDELSIIEEQYIAHRTDPRAMVLTLVPTLACNFGCDYCIEGQHKPHDTMGPAVQDSIIALIESMAPGIGRLSVAWYGGEPLSRKHLIRSLSDRIIRSCAERGIEYSATMITNGYSLDAPTARWLYERRVRTIQVTLDGVAADHDRRRHLLGGQGTFHRIVENLQAVVEATPDLRLWIRVNIDRRNQAHIHELVDHLEALGLGGRSHLKIYFAPVTASTEGCHSVEGSCMKKAAYSELETGLYRYAYDKGLSDLPYPSRFAGVCGAVSPKGYVIVPSGDIHKCWETVSDPHKAIGSLFDLAAVARDPLARRWTDWTPFDDDRCRSCRLLPICAGSCAYKSLYASETRGEAASPCPSWKYSIKERLLLRAEKAGEIGPDDYAAEATRTDPNELCNDAFGEGEARWPAPMEPDLGVRRVRHLPIVN